MTQFCKNAAAGAKVGGGERTAREPSAMLDVKAVAAMLGCSERHVYRLAAAGRMPRPVKLGALVRWSKAAIEDWISRGCPRERRGQAQA